MHLTSPSQVKLSLRLHLIFWVRLAGVQVAVGSCRRQLPVWWWRLVVHVVTTQLFIYTFDFFKGSLDLYSLGPSVDNSCHQKKQSR